MPTQTGISRRLLLASLALPALQGCAAPLPALSTTATTPDAQALLAESAAAHGAAAFASITDINVSYAGEWRALVSRLMPVLVDSGFRGGSQERLLLRDGLVAQAHTGPSGQKQVVRRTAPGEGDVQVWFNGEPTQDTDRRHAAALVADGYSLFLLGPMLLAGPWAANRALTLQTAGTARITQDGQDHACDILRVNMTPGIGLSDADQLSVFIDREQRLMRRVRFTLNGLDATRGAIADVDTFGHVKRHGVQWPTRFHERLLRPLLLSVHDWRLTGLDVDRGLTPADIEGVAFTGNATAPAKQGALLFCREAAKETRLLRKEA